MSRGGQKEWEIRNACNTVQIANGIVSLDLRKDR